MPLIFSDTEKRNYSLLAEDNITKSRVFGLHATHGHHRDYPDFASCLNSYCLVSSYLNLSKLDLDNSAHQNLLVLSQKYLLNTEAPQTFESLSIPDQLNLLRLIDHSLKPSNGMKTSEILDWAALASTPYGPASLGFTVLSKFAAYHEKNTNPEVPDFSFLQKFDSIIFTNPKFLSSIILDINQNSLRTAISTYTYNLIAQEELAAKKSAFPSTEQVAPSNFGLPNFKTDRRTLDSENVFNEASNFAPETVLQMAETKNMVDSLSQTVEAHSELVDTNLEKLDIAEKNAMSSTEILSLCLTGAKQIASLYVGFQQEKKAHKEFRQANEKVLQHLKKMHQQYGIKIQVEEIQAIYRNTPNNPLPSLVQLIHQSALESSKNAQKTFLNLMKEITAFKQDIKDIFIKKESFSQKIESLQSLQLKIARFIKSQDYSSLPIQLSQVCNLTAGMVAAIPGAQLTPAGMAVQAISLIGSYTFGQIAQNESARVQRRIDKGKKQITEASNIIDQYAQLRHSADESLAMIQRAIDTRQHFLREHLSFVPSTIKKEVLNNQLTDIQTKIQQCAHSYEANRNQITELEHQKASLELQKLELIQKEGKKKKKDSSYSKKITDKQLEIDQASANLATLEALQSALEQSKNQASTELNQVSHLLEEDGHLDTLNDWWYEYITGESPKSLAELEASANEAKTEKEKAEDIGRLSIHYFSKAQEMQQHRRQAVGGLFKATSSIADALTPFLGSGVKTTVDVGSLVYETSETFYFMFSHSLSKLQMHLKDSTWFDAIEKFGGNLQFINEFVTPSLTSIGSIISLICNLAGLTKSPLSITLGAIQHVHEALSKQLKAGFDGMEGRFDTVDLAIEKMDKFQKKALATLMQLTDNNHKSAHNHREVLRFGIQAVRLQIENQALLNALEDTSKRLEQISKLKRELKEQPMGQRQLGDLWDINKFSLEPVYIGRQQSSMPDALNRSTHFLDFIPYLHLEMLPDSLPVINFRLIKKTLSVLSKAGRLNPKQEYFVKLMHAANNLFQFMHSFHADLSWLQTLQHQSIEAQRALFRAVETIFSSNQAITEEQPKINLADIKGKMLGNFTGKDKFFFADLLSCEIDKSSKKKKKNTLDHSTPFDLMRYSTKYAKYFVFSDWGSYDDEIRYVTDTESTLTIYYSLKERCLVRTFDNAPIYSPFLITIKIDLEKTKTFIREITDGNYGQHKRYEKEYIYDTSTVIHINNKARIHEPLTLEVSKRLDKTKFQTELTKYFALLENDEERAAVDCTLVFPVESENSTAPTLPLLFPNSYLNELEKDQFIEKMRLAEKLNFGKVLLKYRLEYTHDLGIKIYLNYSFLTREKHIYNALEVEVASFDAICANSFLNLCIENENQYHWQFNANEFLFFAMEGTGNMPGFPGVGSTDLGAGAICPVEYTFIGLRKCLAVMKSAKFSYHSDQYNMSCESGFKIYAYSAQISEAIKDFIDLNSSLTLHEQHHQILDYFEKVDNDLVSEIQANLSYIQSLNELYKLYELALIIIQLCFNVDLSQAQEILASLNILHPNLLKVEKDNKANFFSVLEIISTFDSIDVNKSELSVIPASIWLIKLAEKIKQLETIYNIAQLSQTTYKQQAVKELTKRPKLSIAQNSAFRRSFFSPMSFADKENLLSKNASTYGFNLVDVEADGNCFYHAVNHQLISRFQNNITHLNLRKKAADRIERHINHYGSFIPRQASEDLKEAKKRYKLEVAKPSYWADNMQIQALALECSINFVIIRENGSVNYLRIEEDPVIVIYLGFVPENHYWSLMGAPDETLISGLKNANIIPPEPVVDEDEISEEVEQVLPMP